MSTLYGCKHESGQLREEARKAGDYHRLSGCQPPRQRLQHDKRKCGTLTVRSELSTVKPLPFAVESKASNLVQSSRAQSHSLDQGCSSKQRRWQNLNVWRYFRSKKERGEENFSDKDFYLKEPLLKSDIKVVDSTPRATLAPPYFQVVLAF